MRPRACSCSTWSCSTIAIDDLGGASFVADRGDAGHRLDQAVQRHLAGSHALSRSAIQRLVAAGRVHVNDALPRRVAVRLAPGDVVRIDVAPPRPPAPPTAEGAIALHVLYEDDDLLVVVKPAGLVAHPTATRRSGTLVNALLGRAEKAARPWTPHLVQRLDRGTSGLVVVAKSGSAHTALQQALRDGEKDYLAVVFGRPDERGLLDAPLGRDPLDRRRVVVRASGSAAATEYETLARSTRDRRGLALVRCRLRTGRTHQIRVHLADRGWPIVGDATYGRPPRTRLAAIPLDRLARGFPRPALHAWRVAFRLPATGTLVRFEAAVPDDIAALVAAAGLSRPLAAAAATPVTA